MARDFRWMSQGGLLLDGTGDIAFTDSNLSDIIQMVRSRLKATTNAWKLYPIGANLESFLGNTSDQEAEVSIRRQVLSSLSRNYLPANVFEVSTLRTGGTIEVFVFIQKTLVAQATVQLNTVGA